MDLPVFLLSSFGSFVTPYECGRSKEDVTDQVFKLICRILFTVLQNQHVLGTLSSIYKTNTSRAL
jgi:hypothetical protein